MNKKTLYTILIALGVLVVIALALWWLFSHAKQSGSFGTGQNATSTTGAGSSPTNIGSPVLNGSAPVGSNTGANAGTPNQGYNTVNTNGSQVGYASGWQNTVAQTLYGSNFGTGSSTQGTYAANMGNSYTYGQLSIPNVSWFSNSPTSTSSGGGGGGGGTLSTSGTGTDTRGNSGTVFNPTGINQVDSSSVSYTGTIPDFSSSNGQQSSGGLGLLGTALVAGAAGALTCGGVELFTWAAGGTAATAATAAATAAGTAGVTTAGGVSASASGLVAAISVMTNNATVAPGVVAGIAELNAQKSLQDATAQGSQRASDTTINTFLSCIARTVAKIALQQITNSVVNWINSGFKGSPSFVQNSQQFFTNVADQAAGSFIKGSALSFLCSPFKLQIKIAIANSYANRNAMSCSLTGIIKNITNFMNGDFSQGGWAGLLSFTTMPTNNPYGAFMYANVGLTYYVQTSQGMQQRQLSLANGFLDLKKETNCAPYTGSGTPQATQNMSVKQATGSSDANSYNNTGAGTYITCQLVTTTPGKVIESSLEKTIGSSVDELGLAKDFDEIISALITQLMMRAMQGLSDMSGQSGYASNFQTADQQNATAAAQTLLSEMQADTGYAQQYGGIEQESISDIESSQQQLNTLYNCWESIALGSTTDARKQAANTNALAASSTIQSLQPAINALNAKITQANSSITLLETMQSSALSALSTADTDALTTKYKAAVASGQVYVATDVTTATQDRTTLQGQLTTLNQQTVAGLNQCYAF